MKNKDKINLFILNNKNRNIEADFLEFTFPVSIQSDGNYNLKIGAESSSGILTPDTIILCLSGKYKDYCSFISRTLLIDPEDEQKKAYYFLVKVFQFIV